MRAITIVCAALALSACDRPGGMGRMTAVSTLVPLAPAPAIAARISPQVLPILTSRTLACPFVPAFSTAFDLFIVPSTRIDLFLDRVTFRLIDGSVVGNSPLTFPRPGLETLFGSTLVRAGTSRAFAFQPLFGCASFLPRSIAADLTLVDVMGNTQTMSVTAAFQ